MEHKSNNATVTDEFFSYYMELARKEVLLYQWNVLNDNIPVWKKRLQLQFQGSRMN